MRTKYPLISMIVLFSVAGLLALAGNGDNGPTLNPSPALAANPAMLPLLDVTLNCTERVTGTEVVAWGGSA
ncbi:MAG: hypothetical protein QNL91_12805 [Candidatus Krumholzibacteria bacterium]|nr:hypothetical protein [Candidatus Krumholzibacteria bacterium]